MNKGAKVFFVVMLAILISISVLVDKAVADGWYVTKDGYVAALTKPLLGRATSLIVSGDKKAFVNLVETNPFVIILRGGVDVYLEDTSWFKVKIRVKGTNISVWTAIEAIKKK